MLFYSNVNSPWPPWQLMTTDDNHSINHVMLMHCMVTFSPHPPVMMTMTQFHVNGSKWWCIGHHGREGRYGIWCKTVLIKISFEKLSTKPLSYWTTNDNRSGDVYGCLFTRVNYTCLVHLYLASDSWLMKSESEEKYTLGLHCYAPSASEVAEQLSVTFLGNMWQAYLTIRIY